MANAGADCSDAYDAGFADGGGGRILMPVPNVLTRMKGCPWLG